MKRAAVDLAVAAIFLAATASVRVVELVADVKDALVGRRGAGG